MELTIIKGHIYKSFLDGLYCSSEYHCKKSWWGALYITDIKFIALSDYISDR